MLTAILLATVATSKYVDRPPLDTVLTDTQGKWLVLVTDGRGTDAREEGFRAAGEDSKTDGVRYAVVDCAEAGNDCEARLGTCVPRTLYVTGGKITEYDWEESYSGYFAFGHKLSNPAIYSLQRRTVFDNFKRYEFSFLLWFYPQSFDQGHIARAKLVEKVAEEYHHTQVYFGMVADSVLREAEGISFEDLPIVKRWGSDEAFDFNVTEFGEEGLREFVERFKWGLMPSLNTSLWSRLHRHTQQTSQVLILAFTSGSNYTHFSTYIHSLKMLSWTHRKSNDFRFQMASVDLDLYPALGLIYEIEAGPAIVAIDQRNGTKIAYGYFSPDNKDETDRFLTAVWAGKQLSKRVSHKERTEVRVELTTGLPKISTGEMWLVIGVVVGVGVWCVPRRKGGKHKKE